MISGGGRTGSAIGDARCDGNAAHLAADAADKGGCVGSVRGGEIGNLGGNDVVEDAEAEMKHCCRSNLVGERHAGLPDQQWCGGKQSAHAGLNRLIEWLVHVVRKIDERSGWACEEILPIRGVGIPCGPHSDDERRFGPGFIGIHCIEVEIADGHALVEGNGKRPALRIGCAVRELS